MAQKKNYRADNTYMISTDTTDNPKLGAKVLSDGRESLFLDFNFGYTMEVSKTTGKEYAKKDRKREFLKLYLWQAPRGTQERQQNKETLEIAKRIRFERGQQILENAEGYRLKKDRDINFLDWMEAYYDSYSKKDKRIVKSAVSAFKDFLASTPEFAKYAKRIKPEQITKQMVVVFTEYLQHRFTGEGGHSCFSRFKKIVKSAVEADVIRKNPCNGVVIKIDKNTLKKDALSVEEIQKMIATRYEGQNENIRRAFIFSCYCGLRWCDIRELTYANVDYSNRLLKFEQSKTKGHSSASSVVIPLNDGLLKLIGEPTGGKDSLIFPLPSHTMCLKSLRAWSKKAEVDKHVTWHVGRVSFATNLLSRGANVKVVSELLGHSDLGMVQKYVRAINSQKIDAINSLPQLDL